MAGKGKKREGRTADYSRTTTETDIQVTINIDGKGSYFLDTGVPFLDHMLSLWSKHGLFDLDVTAQGDTGIDDHHTVEDIGICLGKCFAKALGDKTGIKRYGTAFVPMDEALSMAVADLSGRGYFCFEAAIPCQKVGDFDTELVEEFFRAFAINAEMTLHVRQMAGKNTHHIIESMFKAFGRALNEATTIDDRISGVLSTKGSL